MRKTSSYYAPYASYRLLLILIISCLCLGPINAQEAAVARNGIKDHIADLSWSSLVTKPTNFGNVIDFEKNVAVRKLRAAPSQNCAEHLLDSLFVPEKTIMIHLLLLTHDGIWAFDDLQAIDTVVYYFEFHFPNDGLSFGFIDTKGLETLRFNPSYQGELPLSSWPGTDLDTFEEMLTAWSYQRRGVYARRTEQLEFTLYYRSQDELVDDEYLDTQISISRLLIRKYYD